MPFDIPILVYHDVSNRKVPEEYEAYSIYIDDFERQLDALERRGYRAIQIKDLPRIMSGAEPRNQNQVVLTFDDGYQSFHRLVLPALVSRGMTATAFVVASQIGGYNKWDCERDPSWPKRELMTESDLMQAIEAGIEIGVHGWCHRRLDECPAQQLFEEVITAKTHVEDRFRIRVKSFSYPYGAYTSQCVSLLKTAGYEAAVSSFSGGKRVTANLYAMRRISVHQGDTLLRFCAKLSRTYMRYVALRDPRCAKQESPDD